MAQLGHPGLHGSYIKNYKLIHNISILIWYYIGMSPYSWKKHHNVNHHQHTNTIDDLDKDWKPFLRTFKDIKWYPIHKYQHFYAPLIYSIGGLYYMWIMPIIFDYNFYSMFYFIFLMLISKKIFHKNYFKYWLIKTMVHSICFTMINNVTHMNEKVQSNSGKGKNFTEAQIFESSNYSENNFLITYLTGGLNYQTEHHLLQSIEPFHLPFLATHLKKKCIHKKNIFNSYFEIYKSHYLYLKNLSKKK